MQKGNLRARLADAIAHPDLGGGPSPRRGLVALARAVGKLLTPAKVARLPVKDIAHVD